MPLPKTNHAVDPLHKTLFEVCFISDKLTPEENMLLQDLVIRMSQHDITFNVNVIDEKIQPLETLLRFIKDNSADLVIELNLHDKNGTVLGTFEYRNVRIVGSDFFDLDVDYEPGKTAMGINFATEEDEIQKEAIVYFECSRRFFNGVEITNL
ncbi:MAG TPA: hypothetical protein P5509_04250 [Bacteroidales bacterium]|nr:hypothetical protein [Bacteroidales bacterium]